MRIFLLGSSCLTSSKETKLYTGLNLLTYRRSMKSSSKRFGVAFVLFFSCVCRSFRRDWNDDGTVCVVGISIAKDNEPRQSKHRIDLFPSPCSKRRKKSIPISYLRDSRRLAVVAATNGLHFFFRSAVLVKSVR